MPYTSEGIANLRLHHQLAAIELGKLLLECVSQGKAFEGTRVQEYLVHGAGRRVSVLRHALINVFTLFPPDTAEVLPDEAIVNAQINLHAFVINLSGLFDNLAWAFVYRHDLKGKLRRNDIGLFESRTAQFLPAALADHLRSGDISKWHREYVKNYRDALAHRIPLYIPPMILDPDDEPAYRVLEAEEAKHFAALDFEGVGEIRRQQRKLMKPYFAFWHSFTPEEEPRPVQLHPQMIADSDTVIDICSRFFEHWHEVRLQP